DIQIYDEQLRRLASFPAASRQGAITFRETGDGNPLEIGLNSGDDFYRFAFKENMLYTFRPFLSIGLAAFMFFLLAGGYKLSSLLYTYLSFFRFSLIKTANGVLILNSTGQISFLNHRVQTLLDLKHPISKGQHFNDAFAHKPQLCDWIQKGLDSGKPVKEKMSVIQANHQFEGEIRVTPFISSFKLISAYLVEIQDYTQPIVSERLQMWSTSVQKIAHDIKTPLSTVALNLKALQMRLEKISLPKREQVNDDIEMMRTELKRVHNMTKSFLKFTDLEKPHFQVASALEIIADAVAKFDAFANGDIEIQSELDPGGDEIWADPQQVELVLHILIENSIDALKGKGQIKISTSMAQYLDKSFLEFLEVEVSDTGPGIDPKSRDKIFEPYFTTKSDGTGMGLAIARKIIEDHGGVIGLHSQPGLGTVIRFSLPLYENNSSPEGTRI
ncbi:MAG: PAS domain-containing sensor histidine kinase, partial [bacterium]